MALTAIVPIAGGCRPEQDSHETQVIVLGFDGMDPNLCKSMMDAGELPHLAALARSGTFSPLGTSIPPQSPVAWSNLMTGTDSGRHGVFDFVHRDPSTGTPFSSAAKEIPPEPLPLLGHAVDTVSAFDYDLPVRATRVLPNRGSPAFWEYLTRAGVPAHIFRMPANYPPTASAGAHFCCLSDMGTVDIVKSNGGTFSYYTTNAEEQARGLKTEGGILHAVEVRENRVDSAFVGPVNDFVKSDGDAPSVRVPFQIHRDPTEPVAIVSWQDQELLLSAGEWSEWMPVSFDLIPYAVSLKAIARFYLKETHPDIKLYVSPFNFDPKEESWEIDRPEDWSRRVSDQVGRYYTQGLPEDTKALSNQVFSRDEFLEQAEIVFQERLKLYRFALDHYAGGLLFFYFGTTDQIGHMFWQTQSPDHPGVSDSERAKYRNVMRDVYARMDKVVADARKRYPNALLMVISDHGFCDYRRSVNLNTWLEKNQYAVMSNVLDREAPMNFDFLQTRAYAVGLNGLYINTAGRERMGIVDSAYRQSLIDELKTQLLAWRDPQTGGPVVKAVYDAREIYHGPLVNAGPDLIVGYTAGYRSSGKSAMGAFPELTIEDNLDAWGADHCVAANQVPGVLFTSQPIRVDDPDLLDIAPTLLSQFGVVRGRHMTGRNLFGDDALANSMPSTKGQKMAQNGRTATMRPKSSGARKHGR